jgi:16S rRNA (uracil1498-N3)-methyltransferase
MERPRIRLFVDAPLTDGGTVALDAKQAHYLFTVMRLGLGGAGALFNGRDGEWRAEVESAGKNKGLLRLIGQTVAQSPAPDLWLVFAPIKRARIDFLAEKATELGVSRLVPVITQYTDVARVNTGRLRANAIEAAEQTERLSIPEVDEPRPLDALLDAWPTGRLLVTLDESGGGRPILEALAEIAQGDGLAPPPCAILVGPEGGFAAQEMQKLRALPFVTTVGLGPRILRSDTAALAALACWQATAGDWHLAPAWSDHRTAGGNE